MLFVEKQERHGASRDKPSPSAETGAETNRTEGEYTAEALTYLTDDDAWDSVKEMIRDGKPLDKVQISLMIFRLLEMPDARADVASEMTLYIAKRITALGPDVSEDMLVRSLEYPYNFKKLLAIGEDELEAALARDRDDAAPGA